MQEFLKQIIREAGFIAKGYYDVGVDFEEKGDPTDIVTKADREVSNFLIEKIREKYPDHGIISEEEPDEINAGAEYTWVMDPIDGTRNFANRIAMWCTMIGITKNGKPYMGAVYNAINDELFFAEAGQGAYLNDKKIYASEVDDLKSFSLSFSAGQIRGNKEYDVPKDLLNKYLDFYNNLLKDDGHWVSNWSTALTFCYVADGRLDAHVMCGGLYHDYLAPYIICREAGVLFTDSEGNDWQRGRKDVVVANPKLHKKLLELF